MSEIDAIRERARIPGPEGIDITGGIPSVIYVRLQRDECSECIWDYIYELIGDRRTLLSALTAANARAETAERERDKWADRDYHDCERAENAEEQRDAFRAENAALREPASALLEWIEEDMAVYKRIVCDLRDALSQPHAAAYAARVAGLERLPQHIIDLGHNDDCLFCGFKDKAALAALDQEGEG